MGVITSGAFPKNKRPGVFAFTQMAYNEHPEYWKECFYFTTSSMQYEEAVAGNSFGLVPTKGESANISYATESQAHTTRSTHVVYAMGYQISLEEAMDDLYEKIGKRRGGRLAKAFVRTKETVHANLFNRAFNASYTFGDASQLITTTHSTATGNQSNRLATDTDLTEASVEDLCIQIRKATDNVGNKIDLKPAKLVYAPDESFNATRILESDQQSSSANNDTNAIKAKGKIPYHMDNPYFDDTDAWFILTDLAQTEEGLVHFQRAAFEVGMDKDTDNLNEKHFGYERYSRTCFDFRSVYGTSGG